MIKELRDSFYENGYVVLHDVLSTQECEDLKADLIRVSEERGTGQKRRIHIYKRIFEQSDHNLKLFIKEPVVSLAEAIIDDPFVGDIAFAKRVALQAHVIHNNGMIVHPGDEGLNSWHQDDPPHFIVKDGVIPANVHLPVLVVTANYYLSDVTTIENGPTTLIPKSHLFGEPCPEHVDESDYNVVRCTGKAGTVILFNCQTWHRGSPNTSDTSRYVSQVTYARRIIGHKYHPFMNYQMPPHVVDRVSKDPRWKKLAGFLDNGAYG